VCCSVLPCVAVCCSVLPCVAVCCSVLPCVAVCCSVLPCVAVCCSLVNLYSITRALYSIKGFELLFRIKRALFLIVDFTNHVWVDFFFFFESIFLEVLFRIKRGLCPIKKRPVFIANVLYSVQNTLYLIRSILSKSILSRRACILSKRALYFDKRALDNLLVLYKRSSALQCVAVCCSVLHVLYSVQAPCV